MICRLKVRAGGQPAGRRGSVDKTERALTNDKDNTQNSFRGVPPVFQ